VEVVRDAVNMNFGPSERMSFAMQTLGIFVRKEGEGAILASVSKVLDEMMDAEVIG
jgi:hypothetical protein